MTTAFVVTDFSAADVGTQILLFQLKNILFNATIQHLCGTQERAGPDGLNLSVPRGGSYI
jgi:hypothetical protein